jgi:GNAT superfamily N-acetyltransferase
MRIRLAVPADRDQLLALIEGYFEFYRTPYPGAATMTAFLDALQADARLGVQLVAEDGGRLVGFASLYACFDTLVADRILVMNDLFVAPDARGAGTGAALLAGAKAYAAESGYVRLDWVTADDNLDAQRFYDRHGGHRGPWVSYSLPVS